MFSVLSNSERTDMSKVPKVSFAPNIQDTLIEDEEEPRIMDITTPDVTPPFIQYDTLPEQKIEFPNDKEEQQQQTNNSSIETPFDEFHYNETVQEANYNSKYMNDNDNYTKSHCTTNESPVFKYSTNEDEELQKRSVLLDLQQLSLQNGITLTKEWTMDDRLEDMLLEMRRHSLAQDEKSNVTMMRDGMRLLITGIEMINNKVGLLDLDGWSTEVCRDINKHDANLARIYRKYWRRGNNNSPEVSIAMSLFGSMGMHHLRRTMSKNLVSRAQQNSFSSKKNRHKQSKSYNTDSSEDEEAPPKRK
jgi:hypothetical protein